MSDEAELVEQIAALEKRNAALRVAAEEKKKRLTGLKSKVSHVTQVTEQEEEQIANSFFRRIDDIRAENSRLAGLLEEEDKAAKDIVQRITEVRKQRAELENTLEFEQENQMHKLQKSLVDLASNKSLLESKLHQERAAYLDCLRKRIANLADQEPEPMHRSSVPRPASVTGIKKLKAELQALLVANEQHDHQNREHMHQCEELTEKLRRLQMDSFIAKAKAERVKEQLEKAQADLAFEHELSTRIAHQTPDVEESSAYTSMDQESLKTHSSDDSSEAHVRQFPRERDIRAHTHRLLSSATPAPLVHPRRTPQTPPESLRSHSSHETRDSSRSRRKDKI